MKNILRLFASKPQIAPVVLTVVADPVDTVREAAYGEAFETLSLIAYGAFMPKDEAQQIISANGIVDGWFASPAYDPSIAIADLIKTAYALSIDRLQRYPSIWERETAALNGREARRTETGIAIHAAQDMGWCWEHGATLPRDMRILYAGCVGMGIAYGLSLGPKNRYARTDWDIRPMVRKGIVEGLYAKVKGRFDKRSGLFSMELTEDEWLASKAA